MSASAKLRALRKRLILNLDEIDRDLMHRIAREDTCHAALGHERYGEQQHSSPT